MRFPVHTDYRGSYQELAHKSDVKFGQLSIISINKGYSRGGHYHTHKEEWFCCIKGECRLEIINLQENPKSYKYLELDGEKREFVLVMPNKVHTLFNIGSDECEVLCIISEAYDPENDDTIKYEEK